MRSVTEKYLKKSTMSLMVYVDGVEGHQLKEVSLRHLVSLNFNCN